MELQEMLAQIEHIAAKDHEVGRVLKAMVLYLAKLEKAQQAKPSKEATTNGN